MPSQSTAAQWPKLIDPGKKWLTIAVVNGVVQSILGLICTTHKTKLQCVRNCSDAFVKELWDQVFKTTTL